jgi:hypothetical protein
VGFPSLRAKARKVQRHRAAARCVDRERYNWYGTGCPCGLPPGECRDHPRARESQRPPSGDWRTWLVLAGRG